MVSQRRRLHGLQHEMRSVAALFIDAGPDGVHETVGTTTGPVTPGSPGCAAVIRAARSAERLCRPLAMTSRACATMRWGQSHVTGSG